MTLQSTTTAPDKCSMIFVYGTLKYGFPNWHVMPTSVVFLGTARTTIPYPLVVGNKVGCPYVLDLPHHPSAQPVHGELYSVNPETLEFLDEFEGLPTGFYVRKEIDLLVTNEPAGRQPELEPTAGRVLDSGCIIQASVYFRGPGGPSWAQDLTVEYLQTFPMYDRYTTELTASYIKRAQR